MPPPKSPAAAFDVLVADYYQAWFRFHPETAVDLGMPGYAGLLRPYGDDELGAQAAIQEKLLAELGGFDLDALDPDRRLDAQIQGPIDINVSQTELATMVGVSRQTLCMLLGRLQERGQIDVGYKRVRVF